MLCIKTLKQQNDIQKTIEPNHIKYRLKQTHAVGFLKLQKTRLGLPTTAVIHC